MSNQAPPGHLRWARLSRADVPAWTALTNLIEEADGTGESYQEADLAEELEEHGFTPETDSWAVWDGEDLIAYGQNRVSANLDAEGSVRCSADGGVHPHWRRRGIGGELFRRQEERIAAHAAQLHPGTPAHIRVHGGLEGSDRRGFFAARGYQIVRYFQLLTRPLPGEALDVPVPPGYRFIRPAAHHEGPLLEAHHRAFADHWGSVAPTAEAWAERWRARSNRFEVSTLATDAAGTILCYVIAAEWVPGELYINLVATVPEARGRGLAAAALADTLRLAIADGRWHTVELDVDAANPTGATRLYERLGFRPRVTWATMRRDLPV